MFADSSLLTLTVKFEVNTCTQFFEMEIWKCQFQPCRLCFYRITVIREKHLENFYTIGTSEGILESNCSSISPSVHASITNSHNLKTTEVNLMKLHRKITHYEKVCHTDELGSHVQGQGHSRVKSQIMS